MTTQVDLLKERWGNAFDERCEIVDRAAAALGMDEDSLKGLRDREGVVGSMEFLYDAGRQILGSAGLTGVEALQHRVSELSSDPDFAKRFLAGESAARTEWTQLHVLIAAHHNDQAAQLEGQPVAPGTGGGTEALKARRDQLTKDPAFFERLMRGEVAATAEWQQLGLMISMANDDRAAALEGQQAAPGTGEGVQADSASTEVTQRR